MVKLAKSNNSNSKELKNIKEKKINKTRYFQLRLSENEHLELESLFKSSAYSSKSDMIREIIFLNKYKIISIDPKLQAEKNVLIEQTKRIGNNFSQFVKMLHSKKLDYFTHANIETMLELVKKIESHLKNIVNNDSSN